MLTPVTNRSSWRFINAIGPAALPFGIPSTSVAKRREPTVVLRCTKCPPRCWARQIGVNAWKLTSYDAI